jgi:hypothetical protein
MTQQSHGDGRDGDEQGQLPREREARVLDVQPARLAVREQALDEPPLPVEPQNAFAARGLGGGDHQKLASLDPAGAEVEGKVGMTRPPGQYGLEASHAPATGEPGAQREGAPLDVDDLLLLHADGEGDLRLHEKSKPFLTDELAVGEQHAHRAGLEARQVALHQGDALRRGAVPGVIEQCPHQRHPEPRRDHSQYEHVDVGLADLPVGPVQAEIPRAGVADQGRDEADGPVLRQGDVLEEALQATVGRRNQSARRPLGCNVCQIDGSRTDHAQEQDAECLEARLAQGHVRS